MHGETGIVIYLFTIKQCCRKVSVAAVGKESNYRFTVIILAYGKSQSRKKRRSGRDTCKYPLFSCKQSA